MAYIPVAQRTQRTQICLLMDSSFMCIS